MRRLVYPLSSALVIQTEPVARWARRSRLSRQIAVIPNVVEPNSEVSDSGPQEASNVVLSVGRLSPEKGHDILIKAFARVSERFPEWRLKVIGDGGARPHLAALIHSLGLYDRVELAPTQKSVVRDYRACSVFVLPSRFEGFPNTLVEAMQERCAVVAADCPVGPREIVSDGFDGLLFRNEDIGDLASKLSSLLSDVNLRRKLGAQAQTSVQKYRPDAVYPLWDSLIAKVTVRGA